MAKQTSYRGCLLGLAIGDAMGYTVDDRSQTQIYADYGPDGLLGYDLVNGYADVTSYTQLAAFACNGLLMGMTRGQLRGMMAPHVRYVALAEREWAQTQRYAGSGNSNCWVGQMRELRFRRCMDTRMLDTLDRNRPGSPEEPTNRFAAPGALTTAVAAGLFFHPNRLKWEELCRLGAEMIALTHGAPQAFLSGAALAYLIGRLAWDEEQNLKGLVRETADVINRCFGRAYAQAAEVREGLLLAVRLAGTRSISCPAAMEQLCCTTAEEVLVGGIYAALCHPNNFDEALITAVNHSGRSAATGAVTGAILGAKLGMTEIPEFYLEPLEPAETLRELADDLFRGCPMERNSRMFDDDWDRKYVHGGRD